MSLFKKEKEVPEVNELLLTISGMGSSFACNLNSIQFKDKLDALQPFFELIRVLALSSDEEKLDFEFTLSSAKFEIEMIVHGAPVCTSLIKNIVPCDGRSCNDTLPGGLANWAHAQQWKIKMGKWGVNLEVSYYSKLNAHVTENNAATGLCCKFSELSHEGEFPDYVEIIKSIVLLLPYTVSTVRSVTVHTDTASMCMNSDKFLSVILEDSSGANCQVFKFFGGYILRWERASFDFIALLSTQQMIIPFPRFINCNWFVTPFGISEKEHCILRVFHKDIELNHSPLGHVTASADTEALFSELSFAQQSLNSLIQRTDFAAVDLSELQPFPRRNININF